MTKPILVLDFDDCVFLHPESHNDLFLKCYVETALKMGVPDSYEEVEKRMIDAYRTTGMMPVKYLEEHVGDIYEYYEAVHDMLFEIMKENIGPDHRYRDLYNLFTNPDLDIVILSHGATSWVVNTLEKMGLGGLIDEDRILGLDKYGFDGLKNLSSRGFDMALEACGASLNCLLTNKRQAVFADDSERNFPIPFGMGFKTIHVGKNSGESVDKPYVRYRSHCLIDALKRYMPEALRRPKAERVPR